MYLLVVRTYLIIHLSIHYFSVGSSALSKRVRRDVLYNNIKIGTINRSIILGRLRFQEHSRFLTQPIITVAC